MKTKILLYELVGILFITILGSTLHFTYELSGNSEFVAVFSAVNESVWEHIKLVVWPAIFFALIEIWPLRGLANNFWLAKTTSIYFMVLLIPLISYSYTALTGDSILLVDSAAFVITVILGQLLSYKLLTYRQLSPKLGWAAVVLLISLAAAFVVFTFMPPQFPIFQDP